MYIRAFRWPYFYKWLSLVLSQAFYPINMQKKKKVKLSNVYLGVKSAWKQAHHLISKIRSLVGDQE